MRSRLGTQGKTGSIGRTAAIASAALCVLAIAPQAASAVAPSISATTASAVTQTSAKLEAEVNPQGKATLYRFEYGSSDCSVSACTKTIEQNIPEGSSPVPVSVELTGLTPATLYHFRVVARNGETTSGPDRIFATFSSPQPGPADSRAYEQASPVDKDGGDAVGQLSSVKAAANGGGISFGSTFGIPGGKGAQSLPFYVASRSTSAWSTQGLLPPADTGQRARVLGWSPDFSESYSLTAKVGSPTLEAFVAQSTIDGTLHFIAPYAPKANYSYVGTSQDNSVVLFEATAKLPVAEGPEGIEGVPNLYAWDRASGELRLAGVSNAEEAPPKGSIAGSYDWGFGITGRSLREGGGARRYYLQDQHAVAADGSAYFTEAGTGRLFLRRNPTQPQSPMSAGQCTKPEMACTIAVSATEKTDGQGPNGADPAGQQPAAFAAASADGSVAFFTSPEKLTDKANTGPEQPAAAIGRANSATGEIEGDDAEFIPAHAVGVAVDAEYVYWADPSVGTIGRAKLDGSDPDPSFIAPGETECEVEVGSGTGVFEEVTAPSRPRYLAVDSEYVYWTNSGPLEAEANRPINGCGTIGRAKLDGSEAPEEEFIDGQLETAPGKFEQQVSNPQGIAVNATHIYWANAGGGTTAIARAKTDGSEVEAEFFDVTGGAPVPYGVALSATHVYFDYSIDGNDFSFISRVPLTGGAEEFTFIGKAGIRGVAVDATHVYWATQGEGAIGRIALADFASGPCEVVASCKGNFIPIEGTLNGLAADATHLYWSVNGDAPTNPGNDLYRFDATADVGERLEDLSVDEVATNGAEVFGVLGTSADGTRAYFVANGDLDGAGPAVPGDCETPEPHGSLGSLKGECNLYLWQGGAPTQLVARIDADGVAVETDKRNWVPTPVGLFGSDSYNAKTSFTSQDGSTLLFRSTEQLTDYDNEGVPELYRFEVGAAPPITCVSCPPSGEAAGAGPSLGSVIFPGLEPLEPASLASHNLSADGKRAFFETTEALSPEDTNGQAGCLPVGNAGFPACMDVYEWEAPGAGSCTKGGPSYSPLNNGCVYLISTGKSAFPTLFADASADGGDVFFFTRDRLVGQDKDELQDVYDARVGGGLASQFPVAPVPCESTEACHGPAQVPPNEPSPGSATFVGPGNPAPKHSKPKKQQKKHKKHKHKKKHDKNKKQNRASAEQGAGR